MVKKVKTRRELLTDLRRQEILAAALKVFGNKGFASARMEDVATEAQIAKGTLYLYFDSKEEIYSVAVVHAMNKLGELVEERLAGVQGFRERLTAMITLRLEFWREHKILHRMLLTIGREPQHHKQTNTMIQRAANSFVKLLKEGAQSGEVPKQSFTPIALAIVDMMRGANERQMYGLSKTTPKEDAIEIARIAFAALGLPEKKPTGSRRARA